MPEPLFDSRTPRLELPLLFAGQAQKEGFVNEIAARLDALLFLAVEGESNTPPANPADGQSWLVGNAPSGAWTGHASEIASFQSGNWIFTPPILGMKMYNKVNGQEILYRNGWIAAARPATPSGGTTIDSESRAAISAIISALAAAGIVPVA